MDPESVANARKLLTPRRIVVATAFFLLVLTALIYLMLRRPAHVPMDKYVPQDALAFVETDSLTDLVEGLTDTTAWRELAPLLGVSSQWRQIGSAASLAGSLGIGPDEAVVFGRAQSTLAVTDL